jgi:hypothetical protein
MIDTTGSALNWLGLLHHGWPDEDELVSMGEPFARADRLGHKKHRSRTRRRS